MAADGTYEAFLLRGYIVSHPETKPGGSVRGQVTNLLVKVHPGGRLAFALVLHGCRGRGSNKPVEIVFVRDKYLPCLGDVPHLEDVEVSCNSPRKRGGAGGKGMRLRLGIHLRFLAQ